MRKLYSFIFLVFVTAGLNAQLAQKMSYQAVIRNSSNTLVTLSAVGMKISILQGTATGTPVYAETQTPTTNANGLATLEIGTGTVITGVFSAIDWSAGPFFIKTETDPTGGTNYTIAGTSQLLSVPFAFYSLEAANGFSGNYSDLTNKPELFDGTWSALTGKPTGNIAGDIQYWNGTSWVLLPVGQPGQYLQLSGSNLPSWTGPVYPSISTTAVTAITKSTASGSANATSDGGSPITARGICWSTTANPTIANNIAISGAGTGTYGVSIIGLFPATTYYVRAFTTNSAGTSYGNQLTFTTLTETLLANNTEITGFLSDSYSYLRGSSMQGIYNGPDQLLTSSIRSDEAFKGSSAGDQPAFLEMSNFNVTAGNYNILSIWRYWYEGIARCNRILKSLPAATDISEANKTLIAAETRFLRGHYYFYLKRAFKNIPWIDETTPDVPQPNTVSNDGVTFVNCWPQIAADFNYARANLPATQTDNRRPNKWAADVYYAKVLIYRANEGEYSNGYTEALPVLTNAIANGKTVSGASYNLEANYHDLFNCLTENGPEIVWDVQMYVNDGTVNGINGDQKSFWIHTQSASGPGLGRGWGFYQPTPWFADQFRTSGKGLPYLDFYATNTNRLKDDYAIDQAPAVGPDPFVIDTMGLDPRIDWTISRRGIPLLDYGNMPGRTWVRDQLFGGPYISKKFYILKSQDGIFTYPGNVITAMNVHIIRFADVLLLAAECEARVGSLSNARTLVNQVRQRMVSNAASGQNWVKKADGVTNAANYRINIYPTSGSADPFQAQSTALNAILYERGLELGTEGHRFYDVTRFGKATEIFNAYVAKEKARYTSITDGNYVESTDRYLPIPTVIINSSSIGTTRTMTQTPGL